MFPEANLIRRPGSLTAESFRARLLASLDRGSPPQNPRFGFKLALPKVLDRGSPPQIQRFGFKLVSPAVRPRRWTGVAHRQSQGLGPHDFCFSFDCGPLQGQDGHRTAERRWWLSLPRHATAVARALCRESFFHVKNDHPNTLS